MSLRPSAELKSVVERWVDAMNARDYLSAGNIFFRSDAFRYVGSDEHEWWSGTDPIDAYVSHQSEMPPYHLEVEEVEAFESGSVGWAALRTTTTFEGRQPRSLRWTFVFVLDAGIWRMVQVHDSFAVPNPEIMGIEMTKNLEELLGAIGDQVQGAIRASVSQGTVTLLFTDIEDSTALTGSVGDEQWAAVIAWHDDVIRRIVEGGGGSVVKTLGDGAMVVFQSVRDAARAAAAIQATMSGRTEEPELRVRIGMHIGDVVSSEGDYLGAAVNKAARVAASARGGQIMASSAVRALLEDDPGFDFGEPQIVELKGIPGFHGVSELLSVPDGG